MLAEGLGLLQGLMQLQTHSVAKTANGFGTRTRYSIALPGTTVYVSKSTGMTLAQAVQNAQAAQQLGSAEVPFASLEEALSVLSAPATEEAWATPRVINLGPGVYTVGAQIIKRPLSFIFAPAASISDTVMIESTTETTIAHGATGPCDIGFSCPTGVTITRAPCLPGGIQIDQNGTSTRTVNVTMSGIRGAVVTCGAGVNGGLYLNDAGAELHAPALAFVLEAYGSEIEGAALECERVIAFDSLFRPVAVTCLLTNECRLYSTRFDSPGVWTGGLLRIDTATNYDWATAPHGPWVKANPGGVAPVPLV